MKMNLIIIALSFWLLASCAASSSSSKPLDSRLISVPASAARTNFSDTNRINSDLSFNKYNSSVTDAIHKRWEELLESRFFRPPVGIVVVQFYLHSNGTVSDVRAVKNSTVASAGDVCEQAITDVAPFDPWPSDMAKMFNQDYREVTFTFYFNDPYEPKQPK